jgi:uncharacterized protein YerC
MKATDTRSLSREARHERRAQVIRLRQAKHTYDEIAALTGLSRTAVTVRYRTTCGRAAM